MKCKHCNADSYERKGHVLLSYPPQFECYDCNQPERSKREDIEDLGHDFVTVGCTDHRYCIKCHEEDHVVKSKMMRCSELYGKIDKKEFSMVK